jgi:geranylgeranyl diphosphate synthase type II
MKEMLKRYDQLAALLEHELNVEMQRMEAPPTLHDAMCHRLLAKGKRVRGVLLLLLLEAYGLFWHRGMYPALALEMIHCYSLIHDDLPCMDDDYMRRGIPTNHLVFGEAMAVLAGDALLSEAFAVPGRGLRLGAYDAATYAAIIHELATASGAGGMVAGQADDMLLSSEAGGSFSEHSDPSSLLERLRQVHLRKTGALLRAPFRLAAIISELPQDESELLSAFGTQFGLVFQIQDDLLDYLGDAELMGKATGRDIRQRKITYPGLTGVQKSQEILRSEQIKLDSLLKQLQCDSTELERLLDMMRNRER